MKTQQKIDLVAQFLFDRYWIENRNGELVDLSFSKIIDNKLDEYGLDFLNERKDKVLEIAFNLRKKHDKRITLQKLNDHLNRLVKQFPTATGKQRNDLWYEAFKFFTEDYTSEDIIDLGFLPQSCTSFSFYAYDLLKLLQVRDLEVIRYYHPSHKKVRSVHSVLVYYDEEMERKKRCDPKWLKHPQFFDEKNGVPEYRDHFIYIADEKKIVHGKSEKGNPLWYKDPKTLRK